MNRFVPPVYGLDLDPETRCRHYRSSRDIIAIKMKCCGRYYACKDCHIALEDHAIRPWPNTERDEPAVLCGHCKSELTIAEYLACANVCPHCAACFNPGCRQHYGFYFEE